MSIARVGGGSTEATATAASTLVISYTPSASGNHLTVGASLSGGGTTGITVTDSTSTAWTVNSQTDDTPGFTLVGHRENAPNTITSVTIACTGSVGYGHGTVEEWSGVATSSSQSGAAVKASANTPANSLASGNLTPADADCLMIAVAGADDSSFTGAWTTTLGSWTAIFSDGNSGSNHPAQELYQIAGGGSTGPFSVSWAYDVGVAGMSSVLVAFKPAGAAVAATPSPLSIPYPHRPIGERTGFGGLVIRSLFPPTNSPTPAPVVPDLVPALPGLTIPYPHRPIGERTGMGGLLVRTVVPPAQYFTPVPIPDPLPPGPPGLMQAYPFRAVGMRTGLGGMIPVGMVPTRRGYVGVVVINTYILNPSGGIVFSGAAPLVRERIQVPSGGITFSGTATELKTKTYAPSGGIVFSGSAAQIRTRVIAPSGGITFSGSAGMTFTPAGAPSNPITRPQVGAGV